MKIKAAVLTLLLVLVAASSLLAGQKPARLFLLRVPVMLNGAEIPEGVYDLGLDTHKSNVQVTLRKQGRVVATAPGTWVKTGVKYAQNAVLLNVNADGSRSLIEIRLARSAKAILLGNSGEITQSSMK